MKLTYFITTTLTVLCLTSPTSASAFYSIANHVGPTKHSARCNLMKLHNAGLGDIETHEDFMQWKRKQQTIRLYGNEQNEKVALDALFATDAYLVALHNSGKTQKEAVDIFYELKDEVAGMRKINRSMELAECESKN